MKPLSTREAEITALAARGMSTKGISRRTGISPLTVDAHIKTAMAKLGVNRRTMLAVALGIAMENAVEVDLTQEQLTLARMASEGACIKQMAEAVSLSQSTIKSRLPRLYTAVGVENMAGLAGWYLAVHGRRPGAEIKPIAYRFYANYTTRRGEYDAKPIWAADRDDVDTVRVITSRVNRDVSIDDAPDAVRFNDGTFRLLTAAEIGAWPNWRGVAA